MRQSYFKRFFAAILQFKLCLFPQKLWSNEDFAPQYYGAMQTLPCKIIEPSFFALRNYEAMQTLTRKIMET